MRVTFIRLFNFVKPGLILLPRQSQWAAGHRSGALFFARRQDYFIMTRNFSSTYRDLVPSRQITVTQNLSPHTGISKKRGTATQTATNHTAGRYS
jgi:hypothetical protein